MNKAAVCAATLFALSFCALEAFADTIPEHDGFNKIKMSELNTAPPDWSMQNPGGAGTATVDWIYGPSNPYGITCFHNTKGCVDLDGSTGKSAIFETKGTFDLLAHHTYELSAEVSGNQRGALPGSIANNLEFGFLTGKKLSGIQQETTVSGIGPSSPFTLYTLFYTPSTNVDVRAFFYDVGGTNNIGPILDHVRITAVPLPAAAWLMLSGLAALGAVARRRISAASA